MDGPFVSLLAEQARRLGATVVAGMFERTDDLPFNTLVAVGPDGSLAATYRKIHLYDSFGYRESDRLAAGRIEPVVLDVADLRHGLMTCYDLRFPELGRALVDAGAELFVVPAAWVAGEQSCTTGGRCSPRGPSRTPSTSSRPPRVASTTAGTPWSSMRGALS